MKPTHILDFSYPITTSEELVKFMVVFGFCKILEIIPAVSGKFVFVDAW